MIRTNEAAIKYQKLYQTQKEKREQYEKKDYNRRMTPRDKKKAESRFAFRGNKLETKHIMLIFVMVIVLLLFLDSSYPFHSYFGTGAYILIFFLMESKDCIYKIQNFPFDSYRTIHWMIDLEWFYENLAMLSHEMSKFHLSVNKKTVDIYKQFLHMFDSFLRTPERDIQIIQNIWKFYLEQNSNLTKVSLLYRNVAQIETQLKSEYIKLEETYTSFHIQDSLRKSHKKKMIRSKLHKVLDFKRNVAQKINYFWNKSYNILLEFLLFLSEMTIVLSKFHSLFTDLENILPPLPNFLHK